MPSNRLEKSMQRVDDTKTKVDDSLFHKVLYSREAGAVKRCHTQKFFGHYDVAQHTFNALCILRLLRPDVRIDVVWSLLGHDAPERLTGDIPATAKWFGVTSEKLGTLEDEILVSCGLGPHQLTIEETNLLKGIDLLELYMWTREQVHMGNRFMEAMSSRIESWFLNNRSKVPEDVYSLYRECATQKWLQCKELGD